MIFVLTLASESAFFYGNVAFSIFVLSSKKRYSSFLKKLFFLQKICFKVKVLKTSEISSDCHIKTCRSLKRRVIMKIPSNVFRRTYALFVGFIMKPLRQSIFCINAKPDSNFAVKVAERNNCYFSVHFINLLVQTSVLFNM